jgi:hypothetical protein
MQCRINVVKINKVPKFLTHNPTTLTHSIQIANPTDAVHPYTIPLQLEGIVSYFEYAVPTSAEFEDPEIPHLELTAESPAWNPYDKDFAQLEESHLDWRGHVISVAMSDGPRGMTETGLHPADAVCGDEPHWKLSPVSLQYDAADITNNDNFGAALEATRQVMLVCTNVLLETRLLTFAVSTWVRGRGPSTTSLWHIVDRFHCTRPRTRCKGPHREA